MDATRSMPSPNSPYTQLHPAMSQDCYPAATAARMASPQPAVTQGLGLYSMPDAPQSTVTAAMMASPESEHWSGASSIEPEYVQSQPPDIFSAAFDPFSGLHAGGSSPEAEPGLEFCPSPPSNPRGSVSSSYAASDASDGVAYTPRAKTEEVGEWYHGNEHVLQRSVSQGPALYASASSSIIPHTEDLYGPAPEWSKNGDSHPSVPEYLNVGPDGRSFPRFEMSSVLPSVRIKKKRQRTTPEEATHDCRVCGKLFKRSYNWKSHMETHNPDRKYPHPCTHTVGDQKCAKKFQRKTDLDRHVDSVHLKARNHKCVLCGNRFARRDTLRRHTEDGCPKRFELGVRDSASLTPAPRPAWAAYPSPAFASRQRSFSVGVPGANASASASPMMLPPATAASMYTPVSVSTGFTA